MITAIEGDFTAAGVDWIDVAVAGVTLRAFTPTTSIERIGVPGDQIKLYTHLHVTQDGIALYGFPTNEARTAFEALIEVSGVGPRVALSVLSDLSPEALAGAIASGDTGVFKTISGVGPKTAGRIILDLKDKLDVEIIPISTLPIDSDVIEALTSLGYTTAEAREAVSKIPRDTDLPLEERVRLSLHSMSEE